MINKQFLIEEYKKACKKGRYYYAWVILQNLHRMSKPTKKDIEFSHLVINEEGVIISQS